VLDEERLLSVSEELDDCSLVEELGVGSFESELEHEFV
jgi:hypothetical protein